MCIVACLSLPRLSVAEPIVAMKLISQPPISHVIGNQALQMEREGVARIDVEKSSYHHLSQNETLSGGERGGCIEIMCLWARKPANLKCAASITYAAN